MAALAALRPGSMLKCRHYFEDHSLWCRGCRRKRKCQYEEQLRANPSWRPPSNESGTESPAAPSTAPRPASESQLVPVLGTRPTTQPDRYSPPSASIRDRSVLSRTLRYDYSQRDARATPPEHNDDGEPAPSNPLKLPARKRHRSVKHLMDADSVHEGAADFVRVRRCPQLGHLRTRTRYGRGHLRTRTRHGRGHRMDADTAWTRTPRTPRTRCTPGMI
mmetsp:Transcript_18104/g.58504  ORF Transcript_18104/g.58504 Transcript_18104/m.58504 type:complete len:219 (+) Transcript_18104:576-1232(+)